MANIKKRVLVACGTSIATATYAATKIREMAEAEGISVDVIQCKAMEIKGRVQTVRPDMIVAMTPMPSDLGVKIFSGIPFLSGVGVDKLKADIVEELKK
jgi:galactitol PTS system EIIB component